MDCRRRITILPPCYENEDHFPTYELQTMITLLMIQEPLYRRNLNLNQQGARSDYIMHILECTPFHFPATD